ncbi:hypothetical protein B0H16DRAFT_1315660, partial [Mycena metata]
GYRRLYEVTGTIHRDITTQNMRFCRDVADGKVYGVLGDFDLPVPSNESTVKYRTRTMTYMAKDLLVADPPPHLYRHDLESFFYVLVFLTCQIPGSELEKWSAMSMSDLLTYKHKVFHKGLPPAKANFRALRAKWVLSLMQLFADGMTYNRIHGATVEIADIEGTTAPQYDSVTLGGAVTFDKFAAILDASVAPCTGSLCC